MSHFRRMNGSLDLRYSPDSFNSGLAMPGGEFLRYFRLIARELVETYEGEGLRPSRYLREEAIYSDEELTRIYWHLCGDAGTQEITWGDFAEFRLRYMAHWNKIHDHRATTSKSPGLSELSA